ncbi:hypothetical protein M758_4G229800 [Ceratodon purpureus]|nr:hypothetical protein M758_4G229800 [Ceratodon purpureus]
MAGVVARGGGGGGAQSKNVATAMAIAGRASRACDVCGSQRARWYCHADNAHLCHRCDQNVHSANALARRHERVRLTGLSSSGAASQVGKKRGASSGEGKKGSAAKAGGQQQTQQQQQGVGAGSQSPPSRKRSRLSRRPNPHVHAPAFDVVPKAKSRQAKAKGKPQGVDSHEVPNFITVNIQESPVSFTTHDSATAMSMAAFCKIHAAAAAAMQVDVEDAFDQDGLSSGDADQFLVPNGYLDDFESAIAAPIESSSPQDDDVDDMEATFAMADDVGASDEECYRLDFSDIVGLRDADADAFEGDCEGDTSEGALRAGSTGHESNSAVDNDDEEDEVVPVSHEPVLHTPFKVKQEYHCETYDLIKKEVAAVLEESKPLPSLLRLDYADVLSAWSEHRSLWTDGKRPQTVPDDSTSEAAGGVLDVGVVPDMLSGHGCQGTAAPARSDGGREARVMRYREKRRTRLFSKKIRYEVRKLNAERRPRMKGRFVKRTPGMCSS